MKKVYVFLSALALVAAFSCSREAMETVDNPNYNKEKNEVVTNFVFNVSTSSTQTKQSSGAVQATADDAFRGISNAVLISYALPTAGQTLAADADAGKLNDLATVSNPGTLSNTNSRRVLEMSLPIKTNTLLFYGKAPQGEAYGGFPNVNDCYGYMSSYSITTTAGSADFKIGSRLSDDDYAKFQDVENLFSGIQTLLLNHYVPAGTTISATASPSDVSNKYAFDVTIPDVSDTDGIDGLTWALYAKADGLSPIETAHQRYPLEDKLCTLYKELTTIRSAPAPEGVSELRAGSGEATLRVAKDLLYVLNEVRRAAPICEAEAVAKYFANEVFNRIVTKYFSPTTSEDGEVITGVSFRETSTIVASFLSAAEQLYKPTNGVPAGFFWPTAEQLATVASRNPANFPFDFDLPRGATHISFDTTTKCFYYPQSFNTSAMGGTPGAGASYNAKSYFYPAELMYFGNSPIRTCSKDKRVSDYPNGSGVTAWEDDANWDSDWTGNQVAASTRAVAMKYDIQYGTAMLATKVQFKSGLTHLKDNNHAVQLFWNPGLGESEEPDKLIPITSTTFKMTGLIIGGQSKAVGWDYLPVKIGSPADYQYGFIYDKAIPEAAQSIPSSGTNSVPNYTLVLDNFHAASETAGIYTPASEQDKVYVAIEFLNNSGTDFYGNGNLIRNGGFFYLIGCLDPSGTNGGSITWPTDHPVPPYNADGSSQEVKRVFIQDFLTTATFTLGENSLHYAYLTVPDLRSSSMSLGLSVDLNWETGLNFDDVILGGN